VVGEGGGDELGLAAIGNDEYPLAVRLWRAATERIWDPLRGRKDRRIAWLQHVTRALSLQWFLHSYIDLFRLITHRNLSKKNIGS